MIEPSLFDGPAYNPALDNVRLSNQIGRVYVVMFDRERRPADLENLNG